MASQKLTQERAAARGARELARIKAHGFTRKQQARAEYGRATKRNIARVDNERRSVRRGRVSPELAGRLSAARKSLESKEDKAELAQKRLAHEVKTSGLNSVDIAEKSKADPKDVYKSLKQAKKGQLSPAEYRELRASFENAKRGLYRVLHDDSGQFPDCPVFPTATEARASGAKRVVKKFMDEEQAYSWWKTIGSGAGYFVIVMTKGQVEIWDTRSKRDEKARKR